jgi:hypothetical protein
MTDGSEVPLRDITHVMLFPAMIPHGDKASRAKHCAYIKPYRIRPIIPRTVLLQKRKISTKPEIVFNILLDLILPPSSQLI